MGEEVKVDLFLRKATGLVKEIGPFGAFLLPWTSMAGSGITFYAIQVIYNYPAASVPLAFLIVGIPTVICSGCIALLMLSTPRSAAGYIWGTRFVDPFLGWFGGGWVYWLAQVFSCALVSYVLGTVYPVIFIIMGTAAHVEWLTSFGTAVMTNLPMQGTFVIVIIILLGLTQIIEVKHYMKILMAIWALNTIGLLASLALFVTHSPVSAPAAWNNLWGAGAYETINSLAAKYNLAGYVGSTSTGFWGDTMLTIAYIFWALTGFEATAYVAGEVRNPRASFLYWYMGGMVLTVVWYAGVAAAAYNAYGDFILKYNYVYNLYTAGKLAAGEAAKVTSYMMTPSMPLFAASLGATPVFQILGSLWFWPVTCVLTTYLLATRSAFGMAFDRMFPAAFGAVSDRTHTPIKGSLLTIVASVFWAILMFTSFGYLVSAANTSFWFAFFYLIFSVAAIVLPYKRKDIWEKGIHRRIFGIPDTTFLGALSAIGMLWLLALSTIGISLIAWNVSLLWMAVGILVFVYYVHKMSKRGISIVQVYGEVPPP